MSEHGSCITYMLNDIPVSVIGIAVAKTFIINHAYQAALGIVVVGLVGMKSLARSNREEWKN